MSAVLAPIASTVSTPAAVPTPAAPSAEGEGGFTRALDQAGGRPPPQHAHDRDAAQADASAQRGAAGARNDTERDDGASAQTRAAAHGDTRPVATRGARHAAPADDAPGHARRTQTPDAAAEAQAGAGVPAAAAEDAEATEADGAALPQDLAAWLAALPLARQGAPDPSAQAGDAAGKSAHRGSAARDTPSAGAGLDAAAAAGASAAATAADPMPMPAGAKDATTRAAARASSEAAGRAARIGDEVPVAAAATASLQGAAAKDAPPRAERGADFAAQLAALPAAAAAGAGAQAADTKPVVQAEVRAAVGSEGFAPALGTQLRVMLRDGIEHAQLKLNPAELGPIEVRIDLQGAQAQIDFSAMHAATRQALQEAVPALAGALRESGLTLTGGGVFDQPREQRGQARPDGARQGLAPSAALAAGTTGEAAAAAPARLSRARGVVDLYA